MQADWIMGAWRGVVVSGLLLLNSILKGITVGAEIQLPLIVQTLSPSPLGHCYVTEPLSPLFRSLPSFFLCFPNVS